MEGESTSEKCSSDVEGYTSNPEMENFVDQEFMKEMEKSQNKEYNGMSESNVSPIESTVPIPCVLACLRHIALMATWVIWRNLVKCNTPDAVPALHRFHTVEALLELFRLPYQCSLQCNEANYILVGYLLLSAYVSFGKLRLKLLTQGDICIIDRINFQNSYNNNDHTTEDRHATPAALMRRASEPAGKLWVDLTAQADWYSTIN